jgi:hypothetical protein
MRRYREEDFWYEILTAPDAGGRVTRAYRVTCRHCNCFKSFRSGGRLSDDKMRKHLIREGWDIGRSNNLHVCPGCSEKPKPPVTAQVKPLPAGFVDRMLQAALDAVTSPQEEALITPPPEPLVTLEAAWMACSEDERREFVHKICDEHSLLGRLYPTAPSPVEDQPVEEPPVDEEPDEPADWWIELQRGAA